MEQKVKDAQADLASARRASTATLSGASPPRRVSTIVGLTLHAGGHRIAVDAVSAEFSFPTYPVR
jgi:hypothetical protein